MSDKPNQLFEDEEQNLTINIDDTVYETFSTVKYHRKKTNAPQDPSNLVAIIPGTILEVLVKEGQQVKQGDPLVVLDAMKMANTFNALVPGTVTAVHVKAKDKVKKNQVLVEIQGK